RCRRSRSPCRSRSRRAPRTIGTRRIELAFFALMFSGAAHSMRSPPPCGEGLGVGVVRFVRSWRHCRHTAPPPSPPLPHTGAGSKRSLPRGLVHGLFPSSLGALAALARAVAQAAAGLDGAALRWRWALPFIGILVPIATGPLFLKRFWHRHYGKLAFLWSVL